MNDAITTNGYSVAKGSLADRIWRKLGFGHAHAPRPDDVDGLFPGYMITGTKVHLDWGDRIRVLISGRVHVETAIQTDVLVDETRSYSGFSVLPPNATVPRG